MTIDIDSQWVPDRDRWGRPLIVPPGGGKPVGYTRATTVAKTLDDEGSLTAWAQRMTAAGLVRRPDLYALIGTKLGPGGDIPEAAKKAVQDLCDQAKEAAAASSAANLGNALHDFAHQYHLGREVVVPEMFRADFDAYRKAVEPFEVLASEQFVVLDDHQIAGTLDRLWRLPDGRVVIADLKTGQNLDYSWRSIAVQLAIYANGQRYRDGLRSPLWVDGKVDTDLGIVIHLPVGRGECNLYQVDLRAGTIALQHSIWARNWRKRRDLHAPFVPAPASAAHSLRDAAPAPDHAARVSTEPTVNRPQGAVPGRGALVERVRRIAAADGGKRWLTLNWPDGVPTLKQSDRHTDHELKIIAQLCADAERDLALPFTDDDITTVPAEPAAQSAPVVRPDWRRPADGRKLSEKAAAALRGSVTGLDEEQQSWVKERLREAIAAGRPVVVDGTHTERSASVIGCLVTCSALMHGAWAHDEEFLRILLSAALGTDAAQFPTSTVGAAFASLTLAQSRLLEQALASAGDSGAIPITFAEDGAPRIALDTAA